MKANRKKKKERERKREIPDIKISTLYKSQISANFVDHVMITFDYFYISDKYVKLKKK